MKSGSIITAKPIKIWFTDMWPGFNFEHNYFVIYLSKYFNLELNPSPDLLIHSVYTKEHLKYKCFKVCVTGENTRPDFQESDFHIGFDYNDCQEYLRWPLFLMNRFTPDHLLLERDTEELFKGKSRFCSFVVSNADANERILFYEQLSKYKQIDSGGKHLNNIGGPISDKFEFLRESKFNIAFENSSSPGYTTEKIFDAFLSNCIPIYWGNPEIADDFNEKCFINVHNFASTGEVIDFVKYLDNDEAAYKNMLSQPRFKGNKIPAQFEIKYFVAFFEYVFKEMGNRKPIYNNAHLLKYYKYKLGIKYKNARNLLSNLNT